MYLNLNHSFSHLLNSNITLNQFKINNDTNNNNRDNNNRGIYYLRNFNHCNNLN